MSFFWHSSFGFRIYYRRNAGPRVLNPYRVLVVGLGKRGLHHAAFFKANPRFELVGISSRDPARVQNALSKLGDVPSGDDARSLCFTTEPFTEDWELTGQARVLLPVRASAAFSYAAKLCDVQPDGRSRLVTMGWSSGSEGTVVVPLRATSYVFRRGHRLRAVRVAARRNGASAGWPWCLGFPLSQMQPRPDAFAQPCVPVQSRDRQSRGYFRRYRTRMTVPWRAPLSTCRC